MTRLPYRTTALGELIATAFDRASLLSPDPKEVSRLATQSVVAMLSGALRVSISLSPPELRGLAKLKAQAASNG